MSDQTYDENVETSEYSPKSEFSKAKLVYEAMQKCILSRGQEMKPGYENIKFTKEGTPIKIWVPDARLIYIGSVKALKLLLNPEIKKTKGYVERTNSYEDKIKKCKDNNSYEELKEIKIDKRIQFIKTGKKYIPRIGAKVFLPNVLRPQIATPVIGGWDMNTNFYWDEVLEFYDLLLSCLSDLIDELNYFKQKVNY